MLLPVYLIIIDLDICDFNTPSEVNHCDLRVPIVMYKYE